LKAVVKGQGDLKYETAGLRGLTRWGIMYLNRWWPSWRGIMLFGMCGLDMRSNAEG